MKRNNKISDYEIGDLAWKYLYSSLGGFELIRSEGNDFAHFSGEHLLAPLMRARVRRHSTNQNP